jgi:hypothetical protein
MTGVGGRRKLLVAGLVVAVVVAGGGVALAERGGGRHRSRLAVVDPALPATSTSTSSTSTSTSTSTTATSTAITGTVKDKAGHPVANAYVIGLDSLTVARTDASGRWSMSCELTANGMVGRRLEPLVASPWPLRVQSHGSGENPLPYSPPPSAPGLGYAFSGGAADAASAAKASCDGRSVDFVLPPGGNVDIQLVDQSGAPFVDTRSAGDNLYLPGLGQYAGLETAPVDANGHQRLGQLAGGVLRIDGTTTTLNCSGPGVTPNPSVAGADVVVTPGATVTVTCRMSG